MENTQSQLNDLVGKRGLLKTQRGELRFEFLSVDAAPEVQIKATEVDFQDAVTRSSFRVRFDEGTLIDGSNTKVISGFFISRIF